MRKENLKFKVLMIGPVPRKYAGISVVAGLLLDFLEKRGVKFKYISTYKKGTLAGRIFKFVEGFFSLFFTLLREKFDVYHIHLSARGSFFRKFILFSLLKFFGVSNIFFHLHGSDFEIFLKRNKLAKKLADFMFSRVKCVFVLTGVWKRKLEELLGIEGKFFVLENPIDVGRFEVNFQRDSKKVKILYMGMVEKRKGIYVLLDSASLLPEEIKRKIVFSICGDGEVDKVRKITEEKGLSDIFEFKGWVSGDDKLREFLTSDIYVLPSYREGFAISILEAMASKLPIITTPIYGIEDYLKDGENCLFVKPGDEKDLFEKLKILIKDAEKRRYMGEKNFALVKKVFDIGIVGEKLISYYERLIK